MSPPSGIRSIDSNFLYYAALVQDVCTKIRVTLTNTWLAFELLIDMTAMSIFRFSLRSGGPHADKWNRTAQRSSLDLSALSTAYCTISYSLTVLRIPDCNTDHICILLPSGNWECCHHRRATEATHFTYFPWPPLKATLSIFKIILFCQKQFSETELITTMETDVHAESQGL
jgi:hypothetical protein